MKYFILIFALFFCEIVFAVPQQTQTTKVYKIHNSRRPFIKKSERPYLPENKIIKKSSGDTNQKKSLPKK